VRASLGRPQSLVAACRAQEHKEDEIESSGSNFSILRP
jgi:hypothetical protein